MRLIWLILLPILVSGNHLIMMDVPADNNMLETFKEHITPIDHFEGDIIALSDGYGLWQLTNAAIPYVILDINPMSGNYFMAEKTASVNPNNLSSTIRVLYEGNENWLIKINSADDLVTLNSHPVELKRINFNPLCQRQVLVPARSMARDTLVQQMVDAVRYDTIITNVRRCQNFQTRYSSTDSAWACAQWVIDKFTAYGYDSVFFDTFATMDYAPNVVAIKYGMVYSPQNYVVGCGHYDCTSSIPEIFAPGADDNASGSAYVVELARVLQDYLFEYTIHLIAFCGEEQGLVGSEAYAQQAYQHNDTIVGVVNMDMFAYATTNRDTLFIINDTSYIDNLWLAEMFSACADSYTTLKKRVWSGWRPYSDHASFSLYGYHAVQGRENLNVYNPYYHTTGDTIGGGYNADTMVCKGIKAALATVATLAIPYGQQASKENDQIEPASRLMLEILPVIQTQGKIDITVNIPLAGRMDMKIFDVNGRRVKQREFLIDKPGSYSFMLTDELNTGVYFVMLKIGEMSVQKKFIICK